MNLRPITSSYQMRKHRNQTRSGISTAEKSKFCHKTALHADDNILSVIETHTVVSNNGCAVTSKPKVSDKVKKNAIDSSYYSHSPRNRPFAKDTAPRLISSQEPQTEITWNCNSPEFRTTLKPRAKRKTVSDDVFKIVQKSFIPNKEKTESCTNNLLALWRAPSKETELKITNSETRSKDTAVATKCKGMVEKELKQLITQVGVPLESVKGSSNVIPLTEIEYEQPTNNVYPATIIDNNIPDDAEDVWENDDMFNDEEFIEQTQQLILGHTMTNDHSCKNSTVTRNSPEKLTNTSSVKEMYGKVVTVATAYRSPVENPATISSSNCVHNNAVLDDDMLTSQTQPLISDDDDMQQSTQIIANDHELSNVSCTKKNIIHSPNKRICLPSAVKDNVIINSSSKPTTATPPDISCLDSHLSEASLCDNLWESDDGFDDILCSIKCEEDGNSVDSIFSCATQIYSTLDTSRNDSCESETHPRCCNVNEEKNAACTNEICSSSRLTYDSYLCNRTGLKADEDSLKSLSVGAADKKYPCIEKVNDWLLKANTSQVNNMCSNTAVQTTQIKRLKRLQYSETERKGSVSMQSRCTVEEIERKRRQAIERRLKAMKERPL